MYSHSRIESFDTCARKYKFRYVDNLRMDSEGIEAFVGKRVHEALEKLYRDLKLTKLNTLEELLAFYESAWEKNWHSQIAIVREGFTPGHYFTYGQACIENYYRRYAPFDQTKTLGLEERIELTLTDKDRTYTLQGYIDRLAWDPKTGIYEIHDYKTGGTVPSQEYADKDRQLALYQIGLMQRWPEAKEIRLIWHYLGADKDVVSTRTAETLQQLEQEVIGRIRTIEAETKIGRWDVRVSKLCEWCEYRSMCPAWKHPVAMEKLPLNEYLQDTGVQLVERYASLQRSKADIQAQITALEEEEKKVAEAAYAYADKNDVLTIDGPSARLIIRKEDDFKVPRKMEDPFSWELLRNTLKNAGKLEDVSTVNANMLKYAMKKNRWPEALVKSLTGLVSSTLKKSISLVRK